MKNNKPASKTKTIFTYVVIALMAIILIAAVVCTFIFNGPRLQVVWMGAGLLILNLLIMLFFVGKNMK